MSLDDCFAANRAWSARMRERDPAFFERLKNAQRPELLWIGCSDSRLPPDQVVGRLPGEIFVHRNVANLVVHTDVNCLSVLQYGIDVLGVKHIIVCGHYGCGGVRAALTPRPLGLIDNWLRHLRDVAVVHAPELEGLPDDDARERRLCELNVASQVANVCHTTIVQDAWRRGQPLAVHGWIYDLADGLIRDLQNLRRAAGSARGGAPAAVTV
ncbi:MAG: carbonate dehydratase [Anaeromyxobacteraceae bacterium]